MTGEAADVQLVNDRLGVRPLERHIAFPVVAAGIGDDAFHGDRRVVAAPARGSARVGVGHRDRETIRIEQNLLAVESVTTFRLERSVRPIGVDLARPDTRYKDMPVVIGAVPVGSSGMTCDGLAAFSSSNNSSSTRVARPWRTR